MNLWELPTQAVLGGQRYPIHTDFRDILEILDILDDPDRPEFLRWRIALALFYDGDIPRRDLPAAMAYLADFLTCGEPQAPGPKLLDWGQDAGVIVSDVNRVAGQEIRRLPYLHWWTFLAYFHAIGEGQLSTLVSIRDKLHRGKPLEDWERDYYRRRKAQVTLRPRLSAQEQAQRAELEAQMANSTSKE